MLRGEYAAMDRRGRLARLREVAGLFLRLGATAFGGPAAHISAMDDECVRVRQWLTREEFADILSAANVIPGPSSTELAMLIGLRRAGPVGLLVAGVAFILPATVLVWLIASWYGRSGSTPMFAVMLTGMQPVVVAVIAQALWRLGESVLRTRVSVIVASASLLAILLGVHELLVLICSALVYVQFNAGSSAPYRGYGRGGRRALVLLPIVAGGAISVSGIFVAFLKIGCTIFGSGYILLAFLRTELVERRGWLTMSQLFDAIAIGQVTPGPVFSTATVIGYQLAGHAGALSATVGIFLPAFVFASVSGVVVARVRRSPRASAALDGINAASLGLVASAILLLGRDALTTFGGVITFVLALAILRFTRLSSGWVLLGGALTGSLRLLIMSR